MAREDGYYWVRGIGELPFGGGRAMVAEWRDGEWGFAADDETRLERHFEVLSEKLEPPFEVDGELPNNPFSAEAMEAEDERYLELREKRRREGASARRAVVVPAGASAALNRMIEGERISDEAHDVINRVFDSKRAAVVIPAKGAEDAFRDVMMGVCPYCSGTASFVDVTFELTWRCKGGCNP